MMSENTSALGRLSPRTLAIVLALATVALNLILLGGGLLRQAAADATAFQIDQVRSNLNELDEVETRELERLQAELDSIEADIASGRERLPEPGAPYAVFPQAYSLSLTHSLVLQSINDLGSQSRPTVAGQIDTDAYQLELEGEPGACLDYVAALEAAGGAGLAVEGLTVNAEDRGCSFSVFVVTRTSP